MLSRDIRLAVGLAACLLSAVFVSACGEETPTSPTNSAVYSQTDVRVGTGAEAVVGNTLVANYAGWFYDSAKTDKKGVQFTSSTGTGAIEFTLGGGVVIEGWERGALGMKAGGLRRLVVPPSLAYGAGRYGIIPPNSTLVFEIEVLEIK